MNSAMYAQDQVVVDHDMAHEEAEEDSMVNALEPGAFSHPPVHHADVTQDFMTIDKLQDAGINAADIAKLKSQGMQTVKAVQMTTTRNMLKIKGMSEAKIEKIKEAASKLVSSGFITGTEYAIKRKFIFKVSTGSKEVDKILGGGIESGSITEAFGEFRTGKTQLAHTLCTMVQLPPTMGGANGKAVFIDTEGTFRDERIRAIASRLGIDADAALENILIARAFNSEMQMDLLVEVAARMIEGEFRLLVIDSIIALFRTDYSGRGELSERQQKLNAMLSKLMRLAEETGVRGVRLRGVLGVPHACNRDRPRCAAMSFVADPKKPVGGHVLAHASTTRLYLRKGRGETRICKIFDSPSVPEAEAMYQISEGGIIDAKE
ncbi:Meiotic recombination protein dmc1 [Phlyctochytrium bullatum]|nr:Meiotic recombination protein dmc1 [Phlyctochytrium bullatum]